MNGNSYLVVGAGLSGATLARLASAQEPDSEIAVIDRADRIGGACCDHIEDGIDVHDHGSHIMHTDKAEVWHFLSHFTKWYPYMHRVKAVVGGTEVPLPYNLDSIRANFPPSLASTMEKKLLAKYGFGAKVPISELMLAEDPDLKMLAQYVYENVFVHYTSKQWGKKPEELDSAVTARVPVCVSRDPRYFHDIYQGIPDGSLDTGDGNVLGGYSTMIHNMLDAPNITVRLETPFEKGMENDYDKVFFTGAADELLDGRFGALPYRSERFEVETIMREHFQDNAVVNYPNNYDFTRIHEFKYYNPGMKTQTTIISTEYPEPYVPGENVPYYPLPSEENAALHRKYIDEAAKEYPNIVFFGRLGDYKYYDMDDAVARAMDVFRKEFNTDALPEIEDHKDGGEGGRKTPSVMYLGY